MSFLCLILQLDYSSTLFSSVTGSGRLGGFCIGVKRDRYPHDIHPIYSLRGLACACAARTSSTVPTRLCPAKPAVPSTSTDSFQLQSARRPPSLPLSLSSPYP
ncbi:hypothetical protein F5Y18DRAFT_160298 [Xylariaceae sp. FL1019]|nr:hypothetical protein F5Y18DRAFT_160298 [Xylariaceae sp. FL1019]